jgi:molybdopterin converting factor small subunit
MSTKVHLYSGLKEFTNGQNVAEVHGSTVGECLADLVEQFPRIKPVDNEDELYIVRVIAGG